MVLGICAEISSLLYDGTFGDDRHRSGARIPKLAPAELDPAQAELYQAIAGGRRAVGPQLFRLVDDAGRLEGPFNAFLLQPALGSALQALGSAVRYETGLDGRAREIAILVVANHWDSAFEWYAHEAVGRSLGLDDTDLAGLREGRFDTPDRSRAAARPYGRGARSPTGT